ncbi:MAG TPA: DUF58 domain-containing protein [Anaerolineae bacterium]|nr:DUF58 domain-containing protein [Anaerolineae bacterium]HQK13481.1 DUF58 domain-containing protein [Anaerolineae bacterium]
MNAKPKIRLNSWLLPVLVLAAIITDLVAPYRGWRVLYVGLGGALLVGYLWARSLARGLDLTREMRFGWAQVGDRLVERFTLRNEGWAPGVWVEVNDQSTLPDYHASRGTGLPGRDSIRWHTEATCSRRGLFVLGPTHLHTGDPFGLFSVSLSYPAALPLLVLPPIVPLPNIQIAPGGRSGDGRPRPNALDRTVSASTVREYVTGDSRRWIHWRTTARRDELYVRLFDGTPSGDWWILLDLDEHVQVGLEENATDEHGIVLAASLADQGIRLRHSVGLAAYGKDLVWLPPQQGEGRRWEILRSLALISRGSRPLEEVMERLRPSMGPHTSIIIITPSMSTAWVESLVPLIRSGAVPTVLLMDPASFGGPGNTLLVEAALLGLGVAHYRITKDVLDRPEMRPGQQGRWGWRVLGTGRAVPSYRVADVPWRSLT